MSELKQVLDKARKEVTPTAQEKKAFEKVISKAVAVTMEVIKPPGLGYTLAGSFIRDTWMPDKKEFEIFIMFPENTSREKLEKQGLEVGKQIVDKLNGRYVVAYAEHPYIRATTEGFDIDIVPCYRLKSAKKIKSAVDRTPFHNRWIEKYFPKGLSGEVRLFKQFTKTLGVYGSDTKTQGFAGYLTELLITHYGSFESLAYEASHWQPGRVFIDLQKHHKGGQAKIPDDLRQRFKGQPLIVIDPVDPNRNVAASFTPENFARFVLACERFVKHPSINAFFPKPEKINISQLFKLIEERGSKFLLIQFQRPDVIDDTLWPQLRRTANRLKDIMHEYDFMVIDWGVHSDLFDVKEAKSKPRHSGNSYMLLELGVWKLPAIRKIIGPPVFIRQRASEFKKKYQRLGKVWVEGDRLAAEVKREFLDARKKLEDTLSDSEKELKAKGIGSYIAKSIAGRRGFKILEETQIIDLAKKDREFGLFLKKHVEKAL